MFKNIASQKLIVFAFDSTTNLPKTGDAANITAYVSKDYGTVTVLTDTSATEMDATNAKGYYLFDLTQAETNGDTLLFSAKSTTANIVVIGVPATVFTLPPNFTSLGITAGAINNVTAVSSVSTVTGSVGSVAGNVVGSVGSVIGSVGSVAGNVTGSVGSVAGNISGNVNGSVGSVVGNIGGTVASVTGNVGGSVGSVAGNVSGNVSGNVNGSVGSVAGNVAGTVASVVAAVDANLVSWKGTPPANLQGTSVVVVHQILNEGYTTKGATSASLEQILFEILQRLHEKGITSTTQTIRGRNGSTPVKTDTLNDALDPTNMTSAT